MGEFIYFTEEQKERANAFILQIYYRRNMRKWNALAMSGAGNVTAA